MGSYRKEVTEEGFPGSLAGKECVCKESGDLCSIPGLGWSPEEGVAAHAGVLAWRILKDRGAWWATVHGVTKSQTWLSNEAQHTAQ